MCVLSVIFTLIFSDTTSHLRRSRSPTFYMEVASRGHSLHSPRLHTSEAPAGSLSPTHGLSGSHDAYRPGGCGTYFLYEEVNMAPRRCKSGHNPQRPVALRLRGQHARPTAWLSHTSDKLSANLNLVMQNASPISHADAGVCYLQVRPTACQSELSLNAWILC